MKHTNLKSILAAFLLLMPVGYAGAYEYGTNKDGKATVIFAKDETITIDLSGVQNFQRWATQSDKINVTPSESTSSTIAIIFSAQDTIEVGHQMFHWQATSLQGWGDWEHGVNNASDATRKTEWFQLSAAAKSAVNSIPIPNRKGHTTLVITQSTSHGPCTFTWTGAPELPADAIEGCDGCFLMKDGE